MDLFFVVALLIAAFLPSFDCTHEVPDTPRRGTVRLVRGSSSAIQPLSVSSGRVQIYLDNSWGHICDDSQFGFTEAIVICHQLGFDSASTVSSAMSDTFGYDSSVPYLLDNVDCGIERDYLVILQCSHSFSINTGCIRNGNEASVTCVSTRIWFSPYDGQIRLQGAQYTNQGLVEVYCNGQWGTICDNGFGQTDANTVCKQLGYTGAADYDELTSLSGSNQPIWFTFLPCFTTDSCVRNCQRCPSTQVTSCTHSQDVTVECEYTSSGRNFNDIDTCDFGISIPPIASANITGIIVGAIILGLICTFLPILIPVCICCCLGIGICGASRRRGPSTRLVTTAAPPPPTTAVVTTTQTTSSAYPTQQPISYPAQPPPPAYAAQPPAGYPAQPPAAYPAQPPAAYPAQPQAGYPAQPPDAYPPQGAYPPPDGGYPPQPYPSTAEPPPYGGAAYPPYP